jgi:hypothetical protein
MNRQMKTSHSASNEELEKIKEFCANLLMMQKIIGTTVESMLEILTSKGFISEKEMLSINEDVLDAAKDSESKT